MPDSQLDRRTFLAAGLAACAACAGCPLAGEAFGKGEPAPATDPVAVGTAADYPRDAVYDAYAKSHGFFIVREKGSLYALSAICTHKKSLLKAKGKALACPKHGARFDLTGKVLKAPARKPLPRYAVSRDDAGRLTVDPSTTVDEGARDDEGRSERVSG